METVKNILMRSPEGEDGNASAADTSSNTPEVENTGIKKVNDGHKPSLADKLHDALQEWSNEDQREQELDDKTP